MMLVQYGTSLMPKVRSDDCTLESIGQDQAGVKLSRVCLAEDHGMRNGSASSAVFHGTKPGHCGLRARSTRKMLLASLSALQPSWSRRQAEVRCG